MLSISQILLALLLASIPSIIADASANDTEIPEQLGQYSVEIDTLFPLSGFTPLLLNPVVQHNRVSKREQIPCYEVPGSCNGALCCDNGSCAGTGQVCCGDGVCDGVTCCGNGYCAGAGQTCCSIGVCNVGSGCCEGKTCVGYAEACCDDGSHCPAGYGCFSFGDSNQIVCSPTGGGTAPATSTIPVEPASSTTESTTSPPSEQTSVAAALSSVYYYTYEYEWTTYYYVYEIETFTTYIVTTVLSVMATDSAAASSSFNDITATAAFTAPPTLLPGGSTPSQSPTEPTQATSTFGAGQSSVAGSGTSNTNAAPSAKIRRGEALGVACIVGIVMMIMMALTV